jgi:dsDNA-specific endonuclease/ATPase MutS2
MEFSHNTMHPTYRMLVDIPGQSYGLEVARHVGLPAALITRAEELRGSKIADIEKAFAQLLSERQALGQARLALESEKAQAEATKLHWQRERSLLQEERAQLAKKLQAKFAQELDEHRDEIASLLARLRKTVDEKQSLASHQSPAGDTADTIKQALAAVKQGLGRLNQQFQAPVEERSAAAVVDATTIAEGTLVFVVPLGKNAVVSKAAKSAQEKLEVAVGAVKFWVAAENVRLLRGDEARRARGEAKAPASQRNFKANSKYALHPDDRFLWDHLEDQCRLFGLPYSPLPAPDRVLCHEEELVVGSCNGIALHTPGHTPGSMSFYFPDQQLVIAGDTLFRGSVGRTDLWGGETLPRSLSRFVGFFMG